MLKIKIEQFDDMFSLSLSLHCLYLVSPTFQFIFLLYDESRLNFSYDNGYTLYSPIERQKERESS